MYRYYWNKTCIVRAIRSIKVGEEILDCYGPVYHSTDTVKRQTYLNAQYQFSCNCLACQNDWYHKLSLKTAVFICPKCRAGETGNQCDKCHTDLRKVRKEATVYKNKLSDAKKTIADKLRLVISDMPQRFEPELLKTLAKLEMILEAPNQNFIVGDEVLKVFWSISRPQ